MKKLDFLSNFAKIGFNLLKSPEAMWRKMSIVLIERRKYALSLIKRKEAKDF